MIDTDNLLQVDISKNKMEQHNDKTRKIQCILNTGGKDFKSDVEFYRTQKTCHIWFPLAVLQEEVCCYFDRSASSFPKVL